MAASCSACREPLPESGAYSVSVSLDPAATKRWRTCAMACSVACLVTVAAQMRAGAERRAQNIAERAGNADVAGLMAETPRGRR